MTFYLNKCFCGPRKENHFKKNKNLLLKTRETKPISVWAMYALLSLIKFPHNISMFDPFCTYILISKALSKL